MAISNAMKIEAIQRALNSNKNLKTCLQDVASEKSDAPGGVTISDEDVPSVREDDLRMMFAVQRTMDNIVEGAIKNSEKETGDEKKTNKNVIAGAKRLAKKIKPMTMSPSKMEDVVNQLKNHLGV